ncbi:MAG: [protein-PII] uridylyltransferase [Pseudohongiellaceae bacterium]
MIFKSEPPLQIQPTNAPEDFFALVDSRALSSAIAKPGANFTDILSNALQQAGDVLDEKYRQNLKISDIVSSRASVADQILGFAWKTQIWPKSEQISLIAVGGYGRGELLPHSDIDLLVLTKKDSGNIYKEQVSRFVALLWDIGLEVGMSVRSIKQCVKESQNDITVATALMESRTLVGDPALHEEMMRATLDRKVWPIKTFVKAKLDEQAARHQKYHDVDYALEPNVKTSPGGLRDIQTIAWVSKRHFGATSFRDLVELGFLKKSEETMINRGQQFLWKIRYGLHLLAQRCEDRLLFDKQRELARMFGYEDDAKSLGVEKLMKQYYRAVGNLRELNDVLLQYFNEVIIRADEREIIKEINSRFQIRNDYIEVKYLNVFQRTPSAMLEIFVLMAQDESIQGVRASTIRLIRESRNLINDEYRKDIRNVSLFMELLRSPYELTAQLRRMARYGVLGRYLPEFGKIAGQMQHDLFHIYSVDAHTLQVVENMRRFLLPQAKENFPLAAQVVNKLPKIELIYIAGLYHDIAKGRGGDHSELGKIDATEFCQRHRLSDWDTKLVSWVVEKHLIMSMTAQRKDISDPAIIHDFAVLMGDSLHLDYLYVMTVADICATNPSMWNSWRSSLLHQLYTNTKRAFSRGLENTVNRDERIADTKALAFQQLLGKGLRANKINEVWENTAAEYFVRESVKNIVWHSEAIASHAEEGPLISVREIADSNGEVGATQVFICTPNADFLFANSAAAFEKLNLNIHGARIFTSHNDYCMDTYAVLEDNGLPVGNNPRRRAEIVALLSEYLRSPNKPIKPPSFRQSRKDKYFAKPVQVAITNGEGKNYSTLEVNCPDQPGILACVGQVFADYSINLKDARITTLGERVEDLFFITDETGKPITSAELMEQLREDVETKLEDHLNP